MFLISCLIGVASSIATFHLLNWYPYNFGKNLIGVFVPPLFSLIYLTYTGFRYKLTSALLIKVLVLYALQIIPFLPLFFQTFQPTSEDDFSRYYLYAKHMFDNHTLWGGDKLFFSDAG